MCERVRYQGWRPEEAADAFGVSTHTAYRWLGRFDRPGKRALGQGPGRRSRGAGWEAVHVCVDDATRLAYVEVLPNERAVTTVGFLERAVAWFAQRGVTVAAVMSDNGSPYVSKAWAAACAQTGIDHIRTRPHRPRTNGKAERFIQTMLREWAYAATYRSSTTDNAHSPPGSTTTTTNNPTAPSATTRPPAAYPATDQRHWELHLATPPRARPELDRSHDAASVELGWPEVSPTRLPNASSC